MTRQQCTHLRAHNVLPSPCCSSFCHAGATYSCPDHTACKGGMCVPTTTFSKQACTKGNNVCLSTTSFCFNKRAYKCPPGGMCLGKGPCVFKAK